MGKQMTTIRLPAANSPDQQLRSQASYRFPLARIGGEGHAISTIAEACARTEDQVRSAIRKIRKQGDGSVSWAQLYEALGV
jgi:hypothetical protein